MNGFQVLPINLTHALKTYSLPDHHKDPFDRLLVAQAVSEDLALPERNAGATIPTTATH